MLCAVEDTTTMRDGLFCTHDDMVPQESVSCSRQISRLVIFKELHAKLSKVGMCRCFQWLAMTYQGLHRGQQIPSERKMAKVIGSWIEQHNNSNLPMSQDIHSRGIKCRA